MPMWRCPHCGTPQAETARCWVCRRSSTACGTCRNFRRSVAAQLGYCGLDRRRQPLAGDEIRACWDGWPAGSAAVTSAPLTIGPATRPELERHRGFVEVDGAGAPGRAEAPPTAADPVPPRAPDAAEPGWSLWAELEG